MKPAHSAYSANLSRSITQGVPKPPSDTMMRELWIWMSAFYGPRWSTVSGETFAEAGPAGPLWRSELAGLDPGDIARGMAACRHREDQWPPALQEFRAMCRPNPVDHSKDWMGVKARTSMMPSPERLAWHEANIDWIKRGGELPRPGVIEPPAPRGSRGMWEIYRGEFGLTVVES